jgi:hypothetical protein
MKDQNRIYFIFGLLSIASLGWMIWNLLSPSSSPVICLFHKTTGLPCPSCGITASLRSIVSGEFMQAWMQNPLGFLAFPMLVIAPVWIAYDKIFSSSSFYRTYRFAETYFQKQLPVAIMLVTLVLCNWIFLIWKSTNHG